MVEYIIDGCNVIKSIATDRKTNDFECRKSDFIARLQAYRAGKQVGITVVFDSRYPSVECSGRVKVVHARDADRRIAAEAGKRKSPLSLTVVSNDRALLREIKDMGAKSMSVEEFDAFLTRSLARETEEKTPREKPSAEGMSREQVRRWKKELGL